MNTSHEKHLKQRWSEHLDEQTQQIELHWHQVQPRRRKPLGFAVAAGVLAAVILVWSIQPQHSNIQPNEAMLLVDNYSLDALDKRIQQAILRGESASQIDQLWQQRAQLLGQGVRL